MVLVHEGMSILFSSSQPMFPTPRRMAKEAFILQVTEISFSDIQLIFLLQTGVIVKWSLFLAFLVLITAWMVGGRIHAKRRMKKGLKPMGYHAVCLNSLSPFFPLTNRRRSGSSPARNARAWTPRSPGPRPSTCGTTAALLTPLRPLAPEATTACRAIPRRRPCTILTARPCTRARACRWAAPRSILTKAGSRTSNSSRVWIMLLPLGRHRQDDDDGDEEMR